MVNQTKQALEASLKHLLLQKSLDKITISDLTKDCGISRARRLTVHGQKDCCRFLKLFMRTSRLL